MLAPLAEIVVDCPLQIVDCDANAITKGAEFTVTVEVAVFEQPPFEPVTVYVVVLPGLTEIDAVVAPVFHKYVVAPLAVIVADCPPQILVEFAVTEGGGFIVINCVAVFVHPFAAVPVTVYVVVEVGLTEILAVDPPVFQLYVFAPEAVIVVDCPLQIAVLVAEVLTVGGAEIPIATVAVVFGQPEAVPVTVYVVGLVGLAVTTAPVVPLSPVFGAQEYVPEPLAVKVAELPEQIELLEDETATCALAETVTVEMDVLLHPEVVPVTVYEVVEAGETVIEEVLAPVFQE